MADLDGKHVFVSYVREDKDAVDGLCAVLEAAQIPYWRDRNDLGPGDAWRAKIREAIRGGSLVFLACFSDNSRAKGRSYMNEELTLAVDEFRQRPPGATWLIPIRFDSGDVPGWELGAGQMLSDLNYSDLYGDEHTANAARLVTTIHRVMGDNTMNAASALEAVQQVTDGERVDLLKRLTKEMLLDPQKRIDLDGLISQEVQRVLAVLKDDSRVQGPLAGSGSEQVVKLAENATELAALVMPFCASLQVAARFGSPDSLSPWVSGIKTFVNAANKAAGGVVALIDQRHLPGMLAIVTAGIACTAAGKWENLRVLVADQVVRERHRQTSLSILEVVDPYVPFSTDWVGNTLARSVREGRPLAEALTDFEEKKVGKFHTPIAEWLLKILHPVFNDQLPDQETYEVEFDRAEVMLGLVSTDAIEQRKSADPANSGWGRTGWFGRSLWRSRHDPGNPIDDFAHELATRGGQWGPLNASLFGGEEVRATAALEKYREQFNEWGKGMR
ncbi:toll/interleukin-1 receptor domain-containing protein [Nocardioides sp. NPDC127514]|uniref:toll/interleukin-1 receptor domain-containing protein n=1 Tax=unclassified Nocardioides TaxID=2615069 RepID=UPI0033233401